MAEAFLKLWTDPGVYDPSRGSIRTLLALAFLDDVLEELAEVVPPIEPPKDLRDRILSDAAKVVPISRLAPRGVRDDPPVADQVEVAPTLETASDVADQLPATVNPFQFVPWVAAAAGLVFAVFSWIAFQTLDLERESLGTRLEEAAAHQARQDSLLTTLLGTSLRVATLAGASGVPAARLFWNREDHVYILAALELPETESGKEYQLWAISDRVNPMSMGTFPITRHSSRIVLLPVPQQISALRQVDQAVITLEPSGGSLQPTEDHRYIGRWLSER